MKKTMIAVLCLAMALALCGCCLKHTYADATCETPKTCTKCGETEGEVLGHTFADADCVTPKTCTVCSATEGEALGHAFADADCVTPMTCTVCSATEGEALGHTPGAWVELSTDIVAGTVSREQTCDTCGSVTDNDTISMETMIDGDLFLFSPAQFMDRFSAMAEVVGCPFTYEYVTGTDALQVLVQCNDYLAVIQFFGADATPLTTSQANDASMWCASLIFYNESYQDLRCAFLMACDPTLDKDSAVLTDNMIMIAYLNYASAGQGVGYYTENGLLYETALMTADMLGTGYSMDMLNVYASDFR